MWQSAANTASNEAADKKEHRELRKTFLSRCEDFLKEEALTSVRFLHLYHSLLLCPLGEWMPK